MIVPSQSKTTDERFHTPLIDRITSPLSGHLRPYPSCPSGPEELYYPILISTPEGIRGIDLCLFYLNIIWIENQIMAAIPDAVLDSFWDRLPAGTQNQCEHLLINCMGEALIGADLNSLTFEGEGQMKLMIAMLTATEEKLKSAAQRLCIMLDLKDGNASAAASILSMWAGENVTDCNIGNIFL